ncbi:MAG: aminodeoxychorismate lyase [Pseudomonadota bacterium]
MSDWICSNASLPGITPDDRSFAYGDGLFETVAIRRGRARFWQFHCERLLLGCMRLNIPAPTQTELQHALNHALASQPGADGTFKLLLTRGEGPRGYRPPASPVPQLWHRFWPEEFSEEDSSVELEFAGLNLARQTALAGMKHVNRLEQVLGGKNTPEVLFCDAHQNVVCGRMSNVFFVLEESLCTPGLSHAGVAGVARRAVLQVAHASGVEVKVGDFSVSQVRTAEELFICNSRYLIRPVIALAGRKLALGSRTRQLAAGVQQLAESL